MSFILDTRVFYVKKEHSIKNIHTFVLHLIFYKRMKHITSLTIYCCLLLATCMQGHSQEKMVTTNYNENLPTETLPAPIIEVATSTDGGRYMRITMFCETADAEIAAAGSDLTYEVGTMIEIPRAALTADEIAKEADFFCFGTNDLTQMTYGFSRDDAGKFLDAYYDAKIFENDPFAKLDQVGVGKLMDMALKLGKPVNPSLHVGICGEHGGDPSSVEFCNKLGLDYVSCSPFRVPIARLAAAQAAINQK